ncbi:protein kinase domain-containing protein [Gimesia chilikensis]|uniref:protein kinase domain-containing protein n=1 Tax=Gimesia chilikensis TaxID=2605989 RepID=UPI003A8D92CB
MSSDSNLAREIFSNALELDSLAEQENYIVEVCQGDQELLGEVRELLAAHQDAGSFLVKESVVDNLSRNQELPGSLIGKYKLLKQIGTGGMGIVFLAVQDKPVSRQVALKIVKPGMDSQEMIARFQAEQQALAMMNHPNIAQVFDAEITESGRPYFVMELVDGIPLTQFCDKHTLTIEARLKLFVTICRAIQHAHQKGIIHRDLKPSNILVKMHDGIPEPKIIDFGIAKAMGFQLSGEATLTKTFQLIGTPLYMSPEQADLQGIYIDTRSDIYSLSVLLYELLTGKLPFEILKTQKPPIDEMLRFLREEEPVHPSQNYSQANQDCREAARFRQSDPSRLCQTIRGDLDWIVMKGLEKDPVRRYQTAMSLADDIEHYFNNEPVLAGPPTTIYRIKKFIKKYKGLLTTAVSMSLILILGFVVSITFAIQTQEALKGEAEQRKQAEKAEVKAKQNLAKANQAIEQMLVRVGASELAETPHMLLIRKNLLNDAIELYRSLLEDDNANPEILYSLSNTYKTQADIIRSLGQFKELRSIHYENIKISQKLVHDFPNEEKYYILLSRSYVSRAWTSDKILDAKGALLAYQKAQETIEHLLHVVPSNKNRLLMALRTGQYAGALRSSDPEKSLNLFAKSVATYQEQLSTMDAASKYRFAGLLRIYGEFLIERRQFLRAKDAIVLAIDLLNGLNDSSSEIVQNKEVQINLALTHLSLSTLFRNKKNNTDAIEQLLKSQKITRELSRQFPDYPSYLETYHGVLKRIRLVLAEFKDQPIKEKLIENMIARITPESSVEFAFRGNLFTLLGDKKNAEKDFRRSLELDPDDVKLLQLLAGFNFEFKNYSTALDYWDKLIQIEPENSDHFFNRGKVHYVLNQNEKALADISKAIEFNPQDPKFFFERYTIYREQNLFKQALADLNQTILLAPEIASYRYARFKYSRTLGFKELALSDICKAISLSPQNGIYYFQRGQLYLNDFGEYRKALSDFNHCFEISEPQGYQYKRRAMTHFYLKKYEETIQDLIHAIEHTNHDLSTLTFISPSQVHGCPKHEFHKEMLRVTARLKEITPGEGRGHAAHAFFTAEYGDPDKVMVEIYAAASVLEERLAKNVDVPVDNREIGYGFYATHMALHNAGLHPLANQVFELSCHYYELLHEKYPMNSSYRKWLFYFYLNQAKYELENSRESEVLEYFSRAVNLRSQGHIAYQSASWPILLEPRKNKELEQSALKWSLKAVQVTPTSDFVKTMLCVAQYRNRLYQDAIDTIETIPESPRNIRRFYSLNGSSNTISDSILREYILAMSHYGLGDQDAARKIYLQATPLSSALHHSDAMLSFRAEVERTLEMPLTAIKPKIE